MTFQLLKWSEARRAVFLLGSHNENETALWGPALAGKYFESTYTTLHDAQIGKTFYSLSEGTLRRQVHRCISVFG